MKRITTLILLIFVFTLVIAISPASACYDCGPGVGTPGYWKNHPNDWPIWVVEIPYGDENLGINVILKADVLDLLNQPEKGDKSLTLFRAYVAAYLNLEAGNCDECAIRGWLAWGARWLHYNPPGSGVRANSDAWQEKDGENIYNYLDAYNNGLKCAAPRD